MKQARRPLSLWLTLLAVSGALVLGVQLSTSYAAPRPDPFASLGHRTPRAKTQVAPAPSPHEQAVKLRAELGLGSRRTASELLSRAPSQRLREAVAGDGAPSLLWPIEHGFFVRGFGYVRKERKSLPHLGVDISAPEGTPILAVADGVVGYADDGVRGYGNLAILVHADGSVTSYAHCRKLLVEPGQRVARGDVIAQVGTTGISRGPHLHFEYRSHGEPVNPLARFGADSAPTNALAYAALSSAHHQH